MMDRGLDHLVYATPNLQASVDALAERFGTKPVPGGAHPGWGTRNALIGLGVGAYLEIIGPDPEQPDPDGPRPFLIDQLSEARLVTWAYRHPDPESMRDALVLAFPEAPGGPVVRLGPVTEMSRALPDGDRLSWRLSDPKALPMGGIVPFVIDWGATPHPSTKLAPECRLLELVAEYPDPDTLRPVLDSFRPLLDDAEADGSIVSGISIGVAPEAGLRARIRTPNGEIDLS